MSNAPPAAAPAAGRVAPREDRQLPAIGLMVLALLGFTGIDTCAKWLVLDGLPTAEVVFMRYAVHLALVVALALPAGTALARTDNLGAIVLRGLFLLASTVLNFWALGYLPLTMTSAIMFTGPLWICMLSIPLLGETVGPRRWAAIVVGFFGVLVVTRPWAATLHWAVALTLGAALSAALYALLTRRLAGRDSTAAQQFYAALVATIGMAPLAFADWAWPTHAAGWLAFLAVGVFGWGSHQLMIIAHRYAPASTLAPFGYTQIVWMAASSWLIFAEPPDVWVVVGAGIVVASGLYIWLRETSLAAGPRLRRL
jgi:drug/metabolite transporter (DMT)-like permease